MYLKLHKFLKSFLALLRITKRLYMSFRTGLASEESFLIRSFEMAENKKQALSTLNALKTCFKIHYSFISAVQ
jgi:hypothetical protein